MTISLRRADLLHLLTDSGVRVTLGAVSTYGSIRLASEEEVSAENTPSLNAQLSIIKIVTGTLPGLSGGVVLTAAGASYRVHRHSMVGDGESTDIVAYPTTAPTADFWTEGAILLPWASRIAGAAPSPAFDLDTILGAPILVLEAEVAAQGTDPRLNVKVQDCTTAGGTFVDCGYAFDEIADEGGLRVLALDRAEVERYIRLVPVVTGDDDPEFWCGAGVLDVAVPR